MNSHFRTGSAAALMALAVSLVGAPAWAFGVRIDPNGRQADQGSGIDPNGFGATINPDGRQHGGAIDPNGRGWGIDPNGRDAGGAMDPNGRGWGIDPNGRGFWGWLYGLFGWR